VLAGSRWCWHTRTWHDRTRGSCSDCRFSSRSSRRRRLQRVLKSLRQRRDFCGFRLKSCLYSCQLGRQGINRRSYCCQSAHFLFQFGQLPFQRYFRSGSLRVIMTHAVRQIARTASINGKVPRTQQAGLTSARLAFNVAISCACSAIFAVSAALLAAVLANDGRNTEPAVLSELNDDRSCISWIKRTQSESPH
jgi:hypothetical protein